MVVIRKQYEKLYFKYLRYRMESNKFLFDVPLIERITSLADVINPWYIEWHKWFAWYPVKLLNGRWTWLTTVYRRRSKISYRPGKHVIVKVGPSKLKLSTGYFKLTNNIFTDQEDAIVKALYGDSARKERCAIIRHIVAGNKFSKDRITYNIP